MENVRHLSLRWVKCRNPEILVTRIILCSSIERTIPADALFMMNLEDTE